MVDSNVLEKVVGLILVQEATHGLDKKERFIKDCLLELKELKEKAASQDITLTMKCPKCDDPMHGTANIHFNQKIDEFNLDEFEGQDYECSCGYKTHVLTVEPRNERGQNIY